MILIAVISLGAIGAVGAVFLYAASKKFEVYEDPRIAQVQEVHFSSSTSAIPVAGLMWMASKAQAFTQSP